MKPPPPSNNNRDLVKYAGMGAQFLAAIGIAVFIGLQLDKWLHLSPVFTLVLPLVILCGMFYKIYRETSRKKEK